MDHERELHEAFEHHLRNQGFDIKEGKGKLFKPDTIAEKAGTENLYEYKLSPSASDFYRLVYQTYTYEPEADNCYIVTRSFLHKVKEIARRTGWGYIVYDGEDKTVIRDYDSSIASNRDKLEPSECPFSEIFGVHDYNNPELAELENKEYANTYTTGVGKFERIVKVNRKKCPFCGKIVEKSLTKVTEVK